MLQAQIKADMIAAMKAREALKVEVLRGLMAACTNELVATKKLPTEELPDEGVLTVIRREVKKRKDASEQFRKGNRAELADKEDTEEKILKAYLPPMVGIDEIRKVAEKKKAELGITDKKEAGKLMGMVMKEFAGRADGNDVKSAVDSLFV